MGERYLFGHQGIVEEVYLPGKAIISFNLHDQVHRALLWVKGYVHQGKNLEQTDSFHGKLSAGEHVLFDCHIYDRESKDKCGWYAPKAWKDCPGDVVPNTPRVMNQTGNIFELDPGKGVIQFDFNDKEQRVLFLRSKFYHFGKRPGNKHTLSEFLSENDPVQFDAELCEATVENKMCQWLASLVWKGKKPTGSLPWPTAGISGLDDLTAEDSVSNVDRDGEDDFDFPALCLPPGLSDRQGYKAYEINSTPREGRGNVVALINEECGIALWLVRQNAWETVFFHRKHSFIDDTSLNKFDLQESLVTGTRLEICAVPAVQEFPCRWIAHKVVANC